MSLYLTIDRGNSAAKMALWRDSVIIDRCQSQHPAGADLDSLLPDDEPIKGAIYSSVAGDDSAFVAALESRGIPTVVLDHTTPLPLTLAYATPATLGRDRIATAVGAWQLNLQDPDSDADTPLLVIDIGTAVTYDLVVGSTFVGGNIAPGPWMRLEALHHYTSRLPQVDPEGEVKPWADTTATAMRSGAINGIVAEIDAYRRTAAAHSGSHTAKVYITGGDAPLILPHIPYPIDYQPNLVHIGLKSILTFSRFNNEDK